MMKIISKSSHTTQEDLTAEYPELKNGPFEQVFSAAKSTDKPKCFSISQDLRLSTSYYLGCDWIDSDAQIALSIHSKFKNGAADSEIDILKMLFEALQRAQSADEWTELYAIKWKDPFIDLKQSEDLLSPFLIALFFNRLKQLVKRGLRKDYYKVQRSLNGRVKGKVLVADTIKQHLSQGEQLRQRCSYDVFGLDHKENRLLKKALQFAWRYLQSHSQLVLKGTNSFAKQYRYLQPAFAQVSTAVSLSDMRHLKPNRFYQGYKEAIALAKQILARFGYQLQNSSAEKIPTPPFWINMPKLFELYVLKHLRVIYGKEVHFQFKANHQYLDFLVTHPESPMVVDAKYKKLNAKNVDKLDIRQVAGYARLSKVYETLHKKYPESIDCLIVYPDLEGANGFDLGAIKPSRHYEGVSRLGIKLPLIKS